MKQQKGAVSIFVVLFATLLFVAISVGFTVFMMRDQERATDNDLSSSARDSAQAGVEDAKRVLVKYNDCIERADNGGNCRTILRKIHEGRCDTVSSLLDAGGERVVQSRTHDDKLQQAYTCVVINPDTEDVVKNIKNEGDIKLVPLRGKSDFDTVEVSWSKIPEGGSAMNFHQHVKRSRLSTSANPNTDAQLPRSSSWRKEWGSVLRVQSISYAPGHVRLDTLDDDARTAFLYPDAKVNSTNEIIDMASIDKHRSFPVGDTDQSDVDGQYNKPLLARKVQCDTSNPPYACRALLRVPAGKLNYLTLAGVYGDSGTGIDVRIRLLDAAGKPVLFNNVQPKIDATGRANNVFRRVEARVETTPSEDAIPLPRATIATRGDICKKYIISDNASDFEDGICNGTDIRNQP